ncbi:MAG: M1 family aminopeptidase, partial [bacterium]|nr:M1 family aminopeptidase [bacterium]
MSHRASRFYGLLLLSLVVPATAFGVTEGRIDTPVYPTHQVIELDLDANRTNYTGLVRIDVTVTAATKSFEFHAEAMTFDRVEIVRDGKKIPLTYEMEEGGIVTATAPMELQPGEYTLEIDFHKEYNTQAVGLYRMENDGVGYLYTQFEAVDARRAYPCWDEPIYKIKFKTSIHVPADQVVVTNTPVEAEVPTDRGKLVVFKETKPMPTYLLAIAVGPFESIPIEGLSVPGRIYAPKGQIQMANLAAEYAPGILAALEEYFARPYPYAKLDIIAVPEYWPGAMENPGLVTYLDRLLLVDPATASVSQKRTLARVHAHEFAHMWFGDLVTMRWWDDLWLNESFADWLGDKISQELYPQYNIEMTEAQSMQNIMVRDARPSTKAIKKKVVAEEDIMEDLLLAYDKGKSLLRMVEEFIGPDAFQAGVRVYINEHAWGNTEAGDLFSALSKAAGTDLSPIFASYLEQPGYPVIDVAVEPGGTIRIEQNRFVNYGVKAEPQQWSVPVRLKYSDGTRTHVKTFLLEERTAEIHVGHDVTWAMPDAGGFGYYRWNASRETMLRIVENPAETLNERERAAFLGNMKALLGAGEIHGDDYLTVLGAFAGDPDPSTLTAILHDLGSVETAFISDDMKDEFAHYVRETLLPALVRYGMEKADGEAEEVSLLRPSLLSWLGNQGKHAEVREHCRTMAAMYLEDPSKVDPSLAGVALRIAALDGDRVDYDTYRARFELTNVPAERTRYLGAMASFHDPDLQKDVLNYALTGSVRPNEMFTVVRRVNNTTSGREVVFEWLLERYDDIAARMPGEFAAYMPYMASGCSEERLAAASAFFAEPKHQVKGTQNNMAKVVDSITDCVNLREREGETVSQFL